MSERTRQKDRIVQTRPAIFAIGVLSLFLWLTYFSPTIEIVRFTADELNDAYEANEVATDLSLKSKIIEVTGRVQSIDKDALHHTVVRLETKNRFSSAMMGVNKSEESKVVTLQEGQQVVFRCLSIMRVIGWSSGDQCALVSAE